MKNGLLVFTFMISLVIFPQKNLVDSLSTQYDNQQYDLMISQHADKIDNYPAKAIYYLGMAYYMKSDDINCLKYLDLSIKKDSKNPDAYYIKGMTYNYMSNFKNAIPLFKKAIEIEPESSYYLSGLGDSYFSLNEMDKALLTYQEATSKENPIDRPFIMIPQVYTAKNDGEKALKALYISKENISKDTHSYFTTLYNIGLYEILKYDYDKAEVIYKELLEINSNDYEAYSKMIQIYYGKEEYEKAKPYRDSLYEASKKGLLRDHLEDMFCIHQFKWKDKSIRVFERYQEEPKEDELIFDKHLFYVLDEKGEIESRIQTEYSAISMELGGSKYVLGMNKGKVHFTFARLTFGDKFTYKELYNAVLKVLNQEVAPSSSSRRN